MDGELHWHEAMERLRSGAEPAVESLDAEDNEWLTVRMVDGVVEWLCRGEWCRSTATMGRLMAMKWRRVVKPTLHSLPAKWRAKWYDADTCADELDAVLREGEWVNLRGATVEELYSVWMRCHGSFGDLLAYLRSRGAK